MNVELAEQINKAIATHGMWKARLRNAIETGVSEFEPETVRTDNHCDFGKWLHEKVPEVLKSTSIYETVLEYHAEFHVEASRVLALALTGDKEEAEKSMSSSSKFAAISAALTTTMIEWKKEILQ